MDSVTADTAPATATASENSACAIQDQQQQQKVDDSSSTAATTTTTNSATTGKRRTTKVCGATTAKVGKRRKLDDEWAPIRMKLASRTTAQMEGRLKLTITAQCSQKCSGPDQNVYLYHRGLRRLFWHCRGMMMAMSHNQNYSIVLEVRVHIAVNLVEYVVAQVVGNRLMLIHVEFDMLGLSATSAAGVPAAVNNSGGGSGPINIQTVSLTMNSVQKLEDFIFRHADPGILIKTLPGERPTSILDNMWNEDEEIEEEEDEENIAKTIIASLGNGKKSTITTTADKATDTDDLVAVIGGDEAPATTTTTANESISDSAQVDGEKKKEEEEVQQPNDDDAMDDGSDFVIGYSQEIDY
jgi:hypothetical protein